jgi:hypothetical protein
MMSCSRGSSAIRCSNWRSGDVQHTRQLTKAEFVLGAYIEDYDVALAEASEQLLGGDRLQLIARLKIRRDNALHRGAGLFRPVVQRAQQRHDVPLDLVGQAIDDALALALVTKPATRNCRCCDALARLRPARSARASTLRGPWASCSNSPTRCS